MSRRRIGQVALGLVVGALLLPGPSARAAAQDAVDPRFVSKRLPPAEGFRVMIVPDMEGMGSTVDIHEVIAGTEGGPYEKLTSVDYWERFRSLLTQEVNATIAGARKGGAESFVITEGHGGNLFANVLPWELDPEAMLVRGWPRPIVMISGLDETFDTLIFTGAHPDAGSKGVMAHNFAFDDFRVNGRRLNEVGINALIAGEMGVSVSMVSGDDVFVAETQQMLGNGVIGVVVKKAVGGSAAITWSPQRVRERLARSAEEAVRREREGDFAPFTLEKPYRVELTLRSSYSPEIVGEIAALEGYGLEKTGERSFRFTVDDAREIGHFANAVEEVVLP